MSVDRLVREASRSLGRPAAASFKHVSPAGATVAVGALTSAYLRARDADQPRRRAHHRLRGGPPGIRRRTGLGRRSLHRGHSRRHERPDLLAEVWWTLDERFRIAAAAVGPLRGSGSALTEA
ncbi:hypothetical protein ACFY1U_19910 [Streptomyces sp. NPDC001351]|uniref:hypothetical protein n=1 Tax=Streptomyces sp. NPDC001351 TaxID=3364564 RepID=UPI00367ED52C